MKDVFLVYDTSCFYEIVILNYFLQAAQSDVVLCSLDGNAIRTTEGYSVNVDGALDTLDWSEVRSFVIPGGDIGRINQEPVKALLRKLKAEGTLIAAICNGVDFLQQAGILSDVACTRFQDADVVNDERVITARANAYVDFAIEVAKELQIFEDEADLQETIDFWKYFKRAQ